MRLPAFVERLLRQPLVVLVQEVLDVYGRAPGGLLANGLAFATLFATFPLLLLVLGVAGLLIGDPAGQDRLADALKDLFPPLAPFVDQALAAVSAGATAASLLGLISVIWAVSQLYVTLDVAFSRIFVGTLQRDVVGRTLRGFLWVALLIGLVLGVVVLGFALTTVSQLFPDAAESTLQSILGSWPFMLAMGIGVVAVVYRVLPPTTPSMRSIWLPAVVMGVAIVLLSQLFVRLAPLLVGAAAVAGSLATAFIALAWLSFTFQALLYGASWVRVREGPVSAEDTAGSGLASPAAPAEPGGGGE